MSGATIATRRSILAGLAATATAATTAKAGAQAKPENLELLALGDRLEAVAGEHLDAKADYYAVTTEARHVWPRAPEEIRSGLGELERLIDGSGFPEGWRVITNDALDREQTGHREQAERLLRKGGPRRAKRAAWHIRQADKAEDAKPIAKAYWAETARIKAELRFDPIRDRYQWARDALRTHIDATMRTPETTIVGVVIKAQALAAWSDVEPFFQALNPSAPVWSNEITAAIMRQFRT